MSTSIPSEHSTQPLMANPVRAPAEAMRVVRQRPAQLRLLRSVMSGLQRFAPDSAIRLALHLWFRPPVARRDVRGEALLADAERCPLYAAGARIQAYAWGNGPVVALVHGWGSAAGRYSALIETLVAAGFRVAAFDAPGHGRSSHGRGGRRQAHLGEFARGLLALQREFGPLHAVIAHSGGATAAALALRTGLRPTQAVFLAPMATPAAYALRFAHEIGLRTALVENWQTQVLRRIELSWSDLDVVLTPHATRTPHLLVCHDETDTVVPVSDGLRVSAAWPRAELRLTRGLGHNGITRDPAVIDGIVDWLRPARSALRDPG